MKDSTKDSIFVIIAVISIVITIGGIYAAAKADTIQLYLNRENLGPTRNTLVIIPIMTANAYKQGGFYDYYSGKCDESCLTIELSQSQKLGEAGSENTWRTLERLGYTGINDFIVDYYLRYDKSFLERYNTIIVLHSEYVTQRLYDALQSHPNVIYLAPNANYAMVDLNHARMKLVSGHSYQGLGNAFGWKHDNTELEYDKQCKNWRFIKITNGYQLGCNPELIIHKDHSMLKAIKDKSY